MVELIGTKSVVDSINGTLEVATAPTGKLIPGMSPESWPVWHSNLHGTCLLMLSVSSGVLNGLILYTIYNNKTLRNPSNNLQIFLVWDNFLFSISDPWMSIPSALARKWLFGYYGCQFYGFLGFLYGLNNIVILAFIALDRYFVVCIDNSRFAVNTWRKSHIVCAITFIYSFLWSVFPLIGWGSYGFEPFQTACTINWTSKAATDISYCIGCFAATYLLTLPTLVFSYTNISIKLRKVKSSLRIHTSKSTNDLKMPGKSYNHRAAYSSNTDLDSFEKELTPMSSEKDVSMTSKEACARHQKNAGQAKTPPKACITPQEIRIILMSSALTGTFFICWTPYALVCLLSLLDKVPKAYPGLTAFPAGFAKTSMLVNPLLYSLMNTRLRDAMMQQFRLTKPPSRKQGTDNDETFRLSTQKGNSP